VICNLQRAFRSKESLLQGQGYIRALQVLRLIQFRRLELMKETWNGNCKEVAEIIAAVNGKAGDRTVWQIIHNELECI
jgi:hypothetical protein